MASSAAAAAADIPLHLEKYDVFISFRGVDTRFKFTSHLHTALKKKKIETYIDYRLEKGSEIWPSVLKAIEHSTISVIIFSKEYATSTWCLNEVLKILECKKKYGQIVLPICYDISPSHVRYQEGSYKAAFDRLEDRFSDSEGKVNVKKWRAALMEVFAICAYENSNETEKEADLVERVVNDIWTKLIAKTSCDLKVWLEWRAASRKSNHYSAPMIHRRFAL